MVVELIFIESIIICMGYCVSINLGFWFLDLITVLGWWCHSHFIDQNTKV